MKILFRFFLVCLLSLSFSACVTTGLQSAYFQVEKESADIETYVFIEDYIIVKNIDGVAVNKSGPVKIYCSEGEHEFEVSYYRSTNNGYVSSNHSEIIKVKVTKGQMPAVINVASSGSYYHPFVTYFNPNSYGDMTYSDYSFSPSFSGFVTFPNAETTIFTTDTEVFSINSEGRKTKSLYSNPKGKVLALNSDEDTFSVLYSNGIFVNKKIFDDVVISKIDLQSEFTAAELSSDMIITITKSGSLIGYDYQGNKIKSFDLKQEAFEITKRGNYLAVSYLDHVSVINLENDKVVDIPMEVGNKLKQSRVDPVGKQLIVLNDKNEFSLYDIETQQKHPEPRSRLPLMEYNPFCFEISNDGSQFVIVTNTIMATTGHVMYCELGTNLERRTLVGPLLNGTNLIRVNMTVNPRKVFLNSKTLQIVVIGSFGAGPYIFIPKGHGYYLPSEK